MYGNEEGGKEGGREGRGRADAVVPWRVESGAAFPFQREEPVARP